jgi:cell division protein FtsA
MEDSDAEKMKLKYASAYTDNNDIDPDMKYSIDAERQVETRRFIEIVEARVEEIIENVRYQIPAEYYDKLLGGIILTGGGSNMENIEQAFAKYTHIDKVRTAKFVTTTINSSNEQINAKNGMLNTVLGLLIKGDINCAGNFIDPNGNLFEEQEQLGQQPIVERRPRQLGDLETGTIRTAREEELAAEEARRKKEEEDRIRREEEERQAEEERRIRKENSWFNKFKKNLTKFGKDIVSEE